MRLVLASASPRRAELLAAAGYAFDVHAVNVDERLHDGENAASYVRRLARDKSASALSELRRVADEGGASSGIADVMILSADTAVVTNEQIFGKPVDVEDAARMLRRLSGRTHQVLTGVSVRTVAA